MSEIPRCTITGADDNVDPADLVILSRRFPFVEWAILFSDKRAGTPRYPSERWVALLREVWLCEAAAGRTFRLAAHLCGSLSREACKGSAAWVERHRMFRRVQLNGYGPDADWYALARNAHEYQVHWILQARSVDTLQETASRAAAIGRAHVLFDPSGGRGLEPFSWPPSPFGSHVGYAGGIKPENVVETLATLPLGWKWIDMESGVRDSSDRLDFTRVGSVLDEVARVTQ